MKISSSGFFIFEKLRCPPGIVTANYGFGQLRLWQEMWTSLPLKSHGVNAVSNRHNSLSSFILSRENYFQKTPYKTV
jgi:hypothetical protein